MEAEAKTTQIMESFQNQKKTFTHFKHLKKLIVLFLNSSNRKKN